jgi:adenylate cyclase
LERRLAAILAADVVGYSLLMGADEAGTLGRLTTFRREVLEPLISSFRGRIVKLMGDGFLLEFSSPVDAVQCATAWHAAAADGHDRSPGAGFRFRIGINIGDVLIEGDDIHGDGVNVAARLETLAEPGGTCISADAYRQVRGRVEFAFEDMGDQVLKNILEPVRAYRISSGQPRPRDRKAGDDAPAPSLTPSIAVLPFANMSGDREQEYFADGITEDIITDVSKVPTLFVIARNSSFAYKGKSPDVRQVCRDLGVTFVLEGSVRKAGSRVRITAQLVEGSKGGHVWAERYDRDLADIFAVQDEVTGKIVRALEVNLADKAATRPVRIETDKPEAYDHVLRAREQYRLFSRDGNQRAHQLYERAIEIDPHYAGAYAGLALVLLHEWFMGAQDALDRAYELALKARSLDASSPLVYEALGNVQLFRRQHDEAVAAARQWLQLEPGNADAHANLAAAFNFSGEPEQVKPLIEKAMRLNPFYPFYYILYVGSACLTMGRYEEALEPLKRSVAHNPEATPTHLYLAACLGHLGKDEPAREALAEVLRIYPGFSTAWVRTFFPYKRTADLDRFLDGLRKAGLRE